MNELNESFLVRRLVLMDLDAIVSLFDACGRDYAWAERETIISLFSSGDFWGGFLEDELVICCACIPPDAPLHQAEMMRRALGSPLPDRFLLPACFTEKGAAFAAQFFSSVCRCALTDPETGRSLCVCAAVPVKSGTPILSGLFTAGFSAIRIRPLAALRPHYLMQFPRTANHGAKPLCLHIPVSDSYTVCRLLEQGCRAEAMQYEERSFGLCPVLLIFCDTF